MPPAARPLLLALLLSAPALAHGRPRPPEPPPAKDRLVGAWALKADDGRAGTLTFRADGTLTASSTAGEYRIPDYQGTWRVLSEARGTDGGYSCVVEMSQPGSAGAYQATFLFTCPAAMTLTTSVRNGTTVTASQRFVRTAP
jgi:hypothetical protein